MDKITNFNYIRLSSDNEKGRTVYELSPIGVSWRYNNEDYRRDNVDNRLYADIDNHKNLIAIVEGPYLEGDKNRAIILDANNSKIFDVKALFKEQCYIRKIIPTYIDISHISFSGVFFEDEKFYFFVDISGIDFRFSFDVETGEVGKLIESR